MPKKKKATSGQPKKTGTVDRQAGYSLTLGSSFAELTNYDPVAASFLQRTIYNGDYEFTLNVALRSEERIESITPVGVSEEARGDDPGFFSVVGRRVADVLWDKLNISTYGWNLDPNDKASAKYYRASLPPPDEVARFVAEYSFLPRPCMAAKDFWDCLGEATTGYETARSKMRGKYGALLEPEAVEKLKEHLARMSGELSPLAERLTSSPDLLLDEFLFPGSNQNIEICTQHASDGNHKSLTCATATHTFSLDFSTS